MQLIFLTIAGSQLYGLNDEFSDTDLRGVCLDPVESLLGLQGFEQWMLGKEEALEWSKQFNLESDDITIYGLRKFCRLALDANPNILELLFAHNILDLGYDDYYGRGKRLRSIWNILVSNKEWFLSDKLKHTFAGYAYSQLARIKGHKRWIDNPPDKPNPFDYGMVSSVNGGQSWTDSNKYNAYQSLLKDYQSYRKWQNERNPKRKILEEKFGYDTKHAMHLWRLVLEAQELLVTGNLELPLNDYNRDVLLDIKNGKWSYEQVLEAAERAIEDIKAMQSVLPHKPNIKKVENLLVSIYTDYIKEL